MVQCSAVLRYPSHAWTGWFSYQCGAVPCGDMAVCLWSRTACVIAVFRLSQISVLLHRDTAATQLLCLKIFYSKVSWDFFYCAAFLHVDMKVLEEPPSVNSKYVFLAFICRINLIDLFFGGLFFLCGIWEEWEAWYFVYLRVAKAVRPRMPHLKAGFVVGLWLGLGFQMFQVESSIWVEPVWNSESWMML